MSGWDRRWWQQADQFHWFSVYLRDRGLDRQWRLATFAFTLLFAAVPMVMLMSPYGPASGWARAVAIAAAGCGVGVGVVWLIGWPSRTQSLVFHAVCCLSIAAGTLSLSTAYGALMGCVMFAAVGGLLAYFHALVHVLANFAVAAISASVAAARLFAETGDTALVVASLLLVLGLNLGCPSVSTRSCTHCTRSCGARTSIRSPGCPTAGPSTTRCTRCCCSAGRGTRSCT